MALQSRSKVGTALEDATAAIVQRSCTIGHDDQWQINCQGPVALNILINGSPTQPAVWVFAAHDPATGVFGKLITTKEEVTEVIGHIQKRIKLPLPVG